MIYLKTLLFSPSPPHIGYLKTWPFRVFATGSLLAPKWAPPDPPGARPFTPEFPQFTMHRGVDNAENARPAGGVHLFEKDGGGQLFLNFTQFQHHLGRDGALAWDTCSDPDLTFGNGRPIWEAGIGAPRTPIAINRAAC